MARCSPRNIENPIQLLASSSSILPISSQLPTNLQNDLHKTESGISPQDHSCCLGLAPRLSHIFPHCPPHPRCHHSFTHTSGSGVRLLEHPKVLWHFESTGLTLTTCKRSPSSNFWNSTGRSHSWRSATPDPRHHGTGCSSLPPSQAPDQASWLFYLLTSPTFSDLRLQCAKASTQFYGQMKENIYSPFV